MLKEVKSYKRYWRVFFEAMPNPSVPEDEYENIGLMVGFYKKGKADWKTSSGFGFLSKKRHDEAAVVLMNLALEGKSAKKFIRELWIENSKIRHGRLIKEGWKLKPLEPLPAVKE